jgi:hypothetical protein
MREHSYSLPSGEGFYHSNVPPRRHSADVEDQRHRIVTCPADERVDILSIKFLVLDPVLNCNIPRPWNDTLLIVGLNVVTKGPYP